MVFNSLYTVHSVGESKWAAKNIQFVEKLTCKNKEVIAFILYTPEDFGSNLKSLSPAYLAYIAI